MAPLPDVDEGLSMQTYPIMDQNGCLVAMEVDIAFVGLKSLARAIECVEGVSELAVRKPFSGSSDVRVTFRYQGDEYAVVEPFGDNSRYWIGPVSEGVKQDMSPIESQLRLHVPSLLRRIIGVILTLNFRALASG